MLNERVASMPRIRLTALRLDGGTQPRAAIDEQIVAEYADAMTNGAEFPPIVVFFDGQTYWLADGFHRYHAAHKAELADFPTDLRHGTQRDAVLFSVGANATHGLRRTNEDKRRAVLRLLDDDEWKNKGSGWIAAQCAVSDRYVRKLIEDTGASRNNTEIHVQRNGKSYTMNTANIGKAAAEPEPNDYDPAMDGEGFDPDHIEAPPDDDGAPWDDAPDDASTVETPPAEILVNPSLDDLLAPRDGFGEIEPDPEEEPAPAESSNGRHKPKLNRAANEYVSLGVDACQTPPYALDPLLPYLDQSKVIWEPACGQGYLANTLYTKHFTLVTSDLLTGQNFFEYEPELWECLVTNPPYTLKYRWLERCYALGKPFALLLPVETLGAKTAQTLFREHGVQVIFMDQRINFKMPNAGFEGSAAQFPTAWFTWGLNVGQQMVFAELTRNG
jgi:hypothetical protein